jgi:hypothetical protein
MPRGIEYPPALIGKNRNLRKLRAIFLPVIISKVSGGYKDYRIRYQPENAL